MIKSFFFVLSLMVILSSCKSRPEPEIIQSSQQRWIGGAPGSGGGVLYQIRISSKQNLSINDIWLGNREKGNHPKFRIFADSSRNEIARDSDRMIPSDCGLFRIEFEKKGYGEGGNRTYPGPKDPPLGTAPENLPTEFEKGLVIFYQNQKGENKYWLVENLQKLPPLIYP